MNHPPVEVDDLDDLDDEADVRSVRIADGVPATPERASASGMSGTILVVCAGNVARWPVAAALLRARLGATDVSVSRADVSDIP